METFFKILPIFFLLFVLGVLAFFPKEGINNNNNNELCSKEELLIEGE